MKKKLIEVLFISLFIYSFPGIGLSIDSGLHIKTIAPGSAAAEEETLSIGDKILSVSILIHFWPVLPFYIVMKTPENQMFSNGGTKWGYKMGTLVRNGIKFGRVFF